jgi:hypothetical protein
MMMKSGAAMPAAVNRMTAASSPATLKRTNERQYLARLMRPPAPNRNSNSSSVVPLHEKCAGPGTPKCVALERRGVQAGFPISSQAGACGMFMAGASAQVTGPTHQAEIPEVRVLDP